MLTQANSGYVEKLRAAGFSVQDYEGGKVLAEKGGCAAVLGSSATGEPRFTIAPGLLMRQRIVHLTDRGYQKFWWDGDLQFPALAEQLKALHEFERDLRAALGIVTLYNEALGTVSSQYVYDRLEGREDNKHHQPFD